jgi:hypothetical protein
MIDQNTQPEPAESTKDWQKTQYSNLIRYVPSGTYYARLRVKGKLIRKSLKTDLVSVAKLRLADLEKAERDAYSGLCRTVILISVGQGSDFCRTAFRFLSDRVPGGCRTVFGPDWNGVRQD